jgi:hypothetical protein
MVRKTLSASFAFEETTSCIMGGRQVEEDIRSIGDIICTGRLYTWVLSGSLLEVTAGWGKHS